jgi:hypothetical protein
MKKTIINMIIAAVCVISFTACGGNSGGDYEPVSPLYNITGTWTIKANSYTYDVNYLEVAADVEQTAKSKYNYLSSERLIKTVQNGLDWYAIDWDNERIDGSIDGNTYTAHENMDFHVNGTNSILYCDLIVTFVLDSKNSGWATFTYECSFEDLEYEIVIYLDIERK